MNALADFVLHLLLTFGPVMLALAFLVAIAEFAFYYRYEIKWCRRVARWLDSL